MMIVMSRTLSVTIGLGVSGDALHVWFDVVRMT